MTTRNAQDGPGAYQQGIHDIGVLESFADALRAIRESRRPWLSQSRLAGMAGIDHSYVSRLEDKSRTPTREMVHRLATALDATLDERTRLLESAGFTDGLPADVERFRAYPDEVRAMLVRIGEMMTRPGAA